MYSLAPSAPIQRSSRSTSTAAFSTANTARNASACPASRFATSRSPNTGHHAPARVRERSTVTATRAAVSCQAAPASPCEVTFHARISVSCTGPRVELRTEKFTAGHLTASCTTTSPQGAGVAASRDVHAGASSSISATRRGRASASSLKNSGPSPPGGRAHRLHRPRRAPTRRPTPPRPPARVVTLYQPPQIVRGEGLPQECLQPAAGCDRRRQYTRRRPSLRRRHARGAGRG